MHEQMDVGLHLVDTCAPLTSMSFSPLPVVVICGEAGSGKSTLSDKLVGEHNFLLVDGDLVHNSPPWNNFAIMHDLCCQFIRDEMFMQATVNTIVNEVENTLKTLGTSASSLSDGYENQPSPNSPIPIALVVPFVMYTQQSRVYMAQRLMAMSGLVSSVKFVWLKLDEQIHAQRNEDRVEKWASIGIKMHPNDVVNLTKSLTKQESLDDCLVIENSVRSDIEHTLHAIVELTGRGYRYKL